MSAGVSKRWNRLILSKSRQVGWVQEQAAPHIWCWLPYQKRIKAGQPNAWCATCGGTFYQEYDKVLRCGSGDVFSTQTECPHCGSLLRQGRDIQSMTGHRYHDDFDYVCRAEVVGDWQLLRYFIVKSRSWAEHGVEYSLPTEVVRRWMAPGRRTVVESIGMVGYGGAWREIPWNFNGELSIKREGLGGYYTGGTSYRIDTANLARGSKFHPVILKDGFKGIETCRQLRCELYDIPQIFFDPHMVTLLKNGHESIVAFFIGATDRKLGKYWGSMKIAFRHGYKIKDFTTWLDHIENLVTCGLDIHSPRYICPDDLDKEHDLLLKRANKIREELRKEQERKKTKKYEAEYQKKKGRFFELVFEDKNVVISTITSVAEVAAEGEAMHHCVYTNRYFEKDNSLLMSARTKQGERLETIEIGLARFNVLQSRAKYNKESLEHKHILKMLEDHMPEVRLAATKHPKNQAS